MELFLTVKFDVAEVRVGLKHATSRLRCARLNVRLVNSFRFIAIYFDSCMALEVVTLMSILHRDNAYRVTKPWLWSTSTLRKKKKTNNQTYVHFYISRRLTKKQLLLVLKIVSLRQLMDQESPSPLNILHALALCNKSKKGYTIMQP